MVGGNRWISLSILFLLQDKPTIPDDTSNINFMVICSGSNNSPYVHMGIGSLGGGNTLLLGHKL